MSKEEKDNKKKRGHRKKKFGDQESKVISFRIAKDTYERNKEEIREKINGVIDSEVNKKKAKQKEIKSGIEEFYNKVDDSKEIIKEIKKDREKVFLIDPDILKNDDKAKESVDEDKLSQTEEDKDIKYNWYEKYKNKVTTQVQEDVTKINEMEERNKSKKDLFEEFKEFIDKDNEEFREFME